MKLGHAPKAIDELQADLSPPRLRNCYQSRTSTIPPETCGAKLSVHQTIG